MYLIKMYFLSYLKYYVVAIRILHLNFDYIQMIPHTAFRKNLFYETIKK